MVSRPRRHLYLTPPLKHSTGQSSSNINNVRVFENRVLKRIFGHKRDGVTGGWRKLHNEELHHFVHFAKYK
jgi:hypothetical protein